MSRRSKRRRRRQKQKTQQTTPALIEQGRKAFQQADYDAAIKAWREAQRKPNAPADLTPALAEAYFRRAVTQPDPSPGDLQRASDLQPADSRYRYHLALAQHRLGELDEAEPLYRQLLAESPSFERAAEPLAQLIIEQKKSLLKDPVWEHLSQEAQTQLGGDDFDHLLAEHASKLFYKKHQISLKDDRRAMARLDRAAEAAKVRLSDFPEAALREEYLIEQNGVPLHLDAQVERAEFQELTEDLLVRTAESLDRVLADAELTVEEIDRVLLVGGATRMPAVWELVSSYTGLEPDVEINPDEVVALGAAVQAAIIAGQPVDSILVDVTPYSLGIEAAAQVGGQIIPDIFSVLIRRNTTIPVTKEQIFRTLYPDQDSVLVKVYQGEAPVASANTLLGEFLIKGLKPVHPGDHPSVNVRFDFDVNGMLRVRATDRISGSQESISVQATQARLTPHEIVEARERLAEMDFFDQADMIADEEAPPELDEETQALLKRAQALLDSGSLTEDQATELTALMQDIAAADSQAELDELAEELLDMLFDLE